MLNLDIHIYPYSITAFISCCACVWVFFRYLIQIKKTIGFSMILVLAISDFVYSINVIVNNLFPAWTLSFYNPVFFFAIFFSIMWTSAISLLVYKSLANNSSNMKKLFAKTLITVLSISLLITIL